MKKLLILIVACIGLAGCSDSLPGSSLRAIIDVCADHKGIANITVVVGFPDYVDCVDGSTYRIENGQVSTNK